MKKNILFYAVLLISLCPSTFSAQQMNDKNAVVTTEIVLGKATKLIQPPYPPAARAVHADGIVSVEIIGDESGNVVFSKVNTGNPLLRIAAAQAARASKFSPSTSDGKPIKITGVINYNFILPESIEIKVVKIEPALNLTDAEVKELIINSKFQSKVAELAKQMKPENAKLDKFTFVHEGKADVYVFVFDRSPVALGELQKIGFEIIDSQDKRFQRVRGLIPLDKLRVLAELNNVRSVTEP